MALPGNQQQRKTSGDSREDLAIAAGAAVTGIFLVVEIVFLSALAAAVAAVASGRMLRNAASRQMRVAMTSMLAQAMDRAMVTLRKVARGTRADVGRIITEDLPPGLGARAAASVLGVPAAAGWRNLHLALRQAGAGAAEAADHAFGEIADDVSARFPRRGPFLKPEDATARLQAAQKMLDDFARRGVTAFTDARGHDWDLVSYAEMVTRTAASRLHLNFYLAAMGQQGYDLVVVYALTGMPPCGKCAPWVGKVLSISGDVKAGTRVAAVTADRVSHMAVVAGSVAEAMADGLWHPSCRHSMTVFTNGAAFLPLSGTAPGEPPPPRDELLYKREQQLRSLERAMRAARRLAEVAITPAAKGHARRQIAELDRQIRTLTHTGEVPRQRRREQPHGVR
jgi:Phage minor capsid protein 2